jgi:hypothetical protein
MNQEQHLGVVDPAQRDAKEITNPHIDSHLHAADGAAQNDAFAMKFDMPDAAVRAGVVRVEADGQRVGVEP